jgi:hypothetical protein
VSFRRERALAEKAPPLLWQLRGSRAPDRKATESRSVLWSPDRHRKGGLEQDMNGDLDRVEDGHHQRKLGRIEERQGTMRGV